MRIPPLLADFIYNRGCELKCEKFLTRPGVSEVFGQVNRRRNGSSYRNGSCCRFCGKEDSMSREPFEAMTDVMDVKQLAEALQISKAGAYNFLSSPDFPTLRIGGRKLVMKNELFEWLKSRTNRTP